jgi:two-component system, NtrC family, sensor kinase
MLEGRTNVAERSGEATLAWAALDAAPCALLVVDAKGGILFANAQCQRMFGVPSAELVGASLQALLTPECRSACCAALAGLSVAPEAPLVLRDSYGMRRREECFAIELSFGPFGAAPTPMAVVQVRDVSAEQQLRDQSSAAAIEAQDARERLEGLLEHAPAFIVAVNGRGTIDFINRTLPQHRRQDVIGSSWLRYFPPERQALMEAKLRAMYETELTQTFETTTPGPDGATLWFDSQIAPIRTQGKIAGAVLVSQEVTERKRAQSELVLSRQMALLGTLAAGVAHEINTPIQYVGDSIHFLRDSAHNLFGLLDKIQALRRAALAGASLGAAIEAAGQAEESADLPYLRHEMPRAFESCIEGLHQVADIVRSLKDFAHPSQNEMVPADLNRAIQSSLTIATSEYRYVANVETELGELPLVTCHVSEISQAVLNIVINAAHAIGDVVRGSDRKGLITVRTWREGEEVVISIADTGGGIPDAIRSRVFDPFFTTKEVGKGTGQGLAIAWSSVKDRHAGSLTFDSTPGSGTTFFIRLPILGTE